MTRYLLLACLATVLAAEATPPPLAIPDEQAFTVVVIPNLRLTLGHCEQIAAAFSPGALAPGDLAGMLGERLNDAGLAKLAAGPLVIVLGPGGMAPSVAFLIPSTEPALHADALGDLNLQVAIAGGLVVAGQRPADVALGQRFTAAYATLSEMAVDGDVRLMIAPSRILSTYQPVLPGLLQVMAGQMAKQPNGADVAALLTLEIEALISVFNQISTMQIDVDLAGLAISSRSLIAAVPGSGLAAALIAPPAATGPDPAQRMGAELGYLQITGRFNSPAIHGWMAKLLTDLRQKPEGATWITPQMIAMVSDMGSTIQGNLAMRMRSSESNPVAMDMAIGCKDSTALNHCYQQLLEIMFGDTPLGRMYANMGMGATLERDVRLSGGLAVQRIHYTLDADKVPPGQEQMMRGMMQDFEYVVIPGLALGAQQPGDLDRLVRGDAGAMITAASRTLDPGHDGYIDMDYLGMMKAVLASPMMEPMAKTPFFAAIANLPAGEPTGMAWTIANGQMTIQARAPLQPFIDLVAAIQAANATPAPVEEPTL